MDHLSPQQRSKNMAAIRSKDTKPEMIVRKGLWKRGLRYHLNHKRLPGHPDLVLREYRTCIFINGCFWQGHLVALPQIENGQLIIDNSECCKIPKTNREFWVAKIRRNKKRDKEEQHKLAEALPHPILSFTNYYTARTDCQQIGTDEGELATVNESGLEFTVKATRMPYGEYVKRLSRATSVPVAMLHEAIRTWAKNHPHIAINDCFTEHTLGENINNIKNWMVESLEGRFHYHRTHFSPLQTALTNAEGEPLPEIVQARVGMKMEENTIVSDKYLYDKLVYDSPLERLNIRNDIDSVTVYGKIPTRSLQIPTIGTSSYSPDFMYVVRRKGGQTSLNLIVESKAVDMDSQLRGEEKAKIKCAEMFFKSLEEEGYNVKYERQINSKGVGEIIKEIVEGQNNEVR